MSKSFRYFLVASGVALAMLAVPYACTIIKKQGIEPQRVEQPAPVAKEGKKPAKKKRAQAPEKYTPAPGEYITLHGTPPGFEIRGKVATFIARGGEGSVEGAAFLQACIRYGTAKYLTGQLYQIEEVGGDFIRVREAEHDESWWIHAEYAQKWE